MVEWAALLIYRRHHLSAVTTAIIVTPNLDEHLCYIINSFEVFVEKHNDINICKINYKEVKRKISQTKLMNIKQKFFKLCCLLSIALYINILTTTWRIARHHYLAFLFFDAAELSKIFAA